MIKIFSSLDKTHCQKGLRLKVPYFVTEMISGQKIIICYSRMHPIKFNGIYVIFGMMPKQNLMRTSIFVISTLEHNLVRYMALIL